MNSKSSAGLSAGNYPTHSEPPVCLPFDPDLQVPRARLPAGSCDCHFHVYEDPAIYPLSADRGYTPAMASWESYVAMLNKMGFSRAVLVHPSPYGPDHRIHEEVLQEHQSMLRGVAVTFAQTPDADIARWHELGTRGTRFNLISAGGPAPETMATVADKVREYGWHLQLMVDVNNNPDALSNAARLQLPLVVDHIGHTDASTALAGKGWRDLIARVRDGSAWVKLSGVYRVATDRKHYTDARPMWDALIEANPAQLVWGSDWPHPDVTSPMPNDTDLTNLLADWLTEDLRQQILVDNPTRLYWTD